MNFAKTGPATAGAGRILLALLFVYAGLHKIPGYAATQAAMDSHGVPGMLLPAVIALEFGGGLALLVGWRTRTAAVLLALFTLAATFLFHFDPGNAAQTTALVKNFAIMGGLLVLAAHGAGAWSLDARRGGGR